jgi:hypothetical protein
MSFDFHSFYSILSKMFYAFTEILKIFKWPLSFIIIAAIFKKPIIQTFQKIKKISSGDKAVELFPGIQEQSKASENKFDITNAEKAVSFFHEESVRLAKITVDAESGIIGISDLERKASILYSYSIVLFLILNFERVYASIYGSQIKLLQFLNSSPETEVSKLEFFYTEAKTLNPYIYQTYTYEEYLFFLSEYRLINVENSKATITVVGRDFLKFLMELGKAINKAY